MKKRAVCIAVSACAWCVMSAQVEIVYTFTGKRVEKKTVTIEPDEENVVRVHIPQADLPPGLDTVTVLPDFAAAQAGEEGYFIMPNGEYGTFRERNGQRTAHGAMPMPIFGMKNPRSTFVAIVTGTPYDFTLMTTAKDGRYTILPRFEYRGRPAYDDLTVAYHLLKGEQVDYSGMARKYRDYQLARKACVPLKERMKTRPELAYAARSLEVRIRQGWKPVPTPVEHQTRHTEPPMKVAVTFDRVGDILDEFRRQGVDRAEVCLVGWNQKGHDGRYPDLFPVEEQLGGEVKLRALIKKAQAMGFQIVCHNNNSDAYMIADSWDAEFIAKNPDGALSTHSAWSGGRMYNICPQRAYERFQQKDMLAIADLGFRGLHYTDVVTVVPPRPCYDPRHPVNRNQAARWVGNMLAGAQSAFGGAASEGGHDFCCGVLDYALYASIVPPKPHPMVDRFVPFWQLVYHGIILSNPFPPTCNYTIKDAATRLMLTEFGGRPFFYYYSNFLDKGNAWMGTADITCENDEALKASVAKIKEGYDEFTARARLQTEFMDRHERVDTDVYRTVYSDGSEIVCNYRQTAFVYKGRTVAPLRHILIGP